MDGHDQPVGPPTYDDDVLEGPFISPFPRAWPPQLAMCDDNVIYKADGRNNATIFTIDPRAAHALNIERPMFVSAVSGLFYSNVVFVNTHAVYYLEGCPLNTETAKMQGILLHGQEVIGLASTRNGFFLLFQSGVVNRYHFTPEHEFTGVTRVMEEKPIVALKSFQAKILVLFADGTVGQLLDGNSIVSVPRLQKIVQIAVSKGLSAAVSSDGQVFTWGETNCHFGGRVWTPPAPLSGIADAIAVAVGEDIGVILHRNGTLSAWGEEDGAEDGDQYWGYPREIGITDAVAVFCHDKKILIVHRDGKVSVLEFPDRRIAEFIEM
jgi:hypothetical protein